MPVTNTQDVWNRRRIDSTHINPSIMEGERGHTSMFGKGSAVTIIRYAPTFLVQPSITGSFKIPSVLTCNPGVIDASPQANLFFQWKADGVDMPGETNRTITTYLELDAVTLTCEVTAVNFLGVAVGVSNGITAELIEPIINHQYMHYSVTGLNQEQQINTFKSDVLVTTGISMIDRVDMQQHIILVPTGMWVELRDDIMSHTVSAISGLGPDNGGDMYDFDVYTTWHPTLLGDLAIVNHTAATGDMTGWTVTEGTITAQNVALQGTVLPYVADKYYFSALASGTNNASMNQVVDIDPSHFADIDAGLVFSQFLYQHDNFTQNYGQTVQSVFQYLDASDVVLSGTLTQSHVRVQNSHWELIYTDLMPVPVNTRKVRITFNFTRNSTRDNNTYVDEVYVRLFKDEHQL